MKTLHSERPHAARQTTRRDMLKTGLALAGLGLVGIPEWVLPALAQGETVLPFLDFPERVITNPAPDRRIIDVRTINGPFTPKDQWFTTQHYGHPKVDPATYTLKVSGLVDRPLTLSLDDLRKMGSTEFVAGFECSGNRGPLQGLSSNAKWTGVPLKTVLDKAGVKAQAREFVFFGTDRGEEDVEWRTQTFKVQQQFGRALNREKALSPDPLLVYALNGDPLTLHQGSPVRLLVPGWYGVNNVKWLAEIHVQEETYLGKFQARWYRTLKGEMIDGEMKWVETAITHMQLKSYIARVTTDGSHYKVLGVVLNDGTPIKTVEVKVDDGPWQAATMDPSTREKYGWKLFNFTVNSLTPGEHTLVSRAIDATGKIQPTAQELENKKSFLEDNSQTVRKIKI
jgi:DMSO/TMAO reductase YedYZ molybdopterin-dependent catalytic subunit